MNSDGQIYFDFLENIPEEDRKRLEEAQMIEKKKKDAEYEDLLRTVSEKLDDERTTTD